MSHTDLVQYFKTQYNMVRHNGYSHSEVEDMMIFERDVYVSMIIEERNNT